MSLFNAFDHSAASVVGFGVNPLLTSGAANDPATARKLSGMGCRVETCDELYLALHRVLDGSEDFELIVVDCDSIGGLAQGMRAQSLLTSTGRCIPMILISAECTEQTFPFNRYEPTVLSAPLSSISLRVGFEHAMQERLLMAGAS